MMLPRREYAYHVGIGILFFCAVGVYETERLLGRSLADQQRRQQLQHNHFATSRTARDTTARSRKQSVPASTSTIPSEPFSRGRQDYDEVVVWTGNQELKDYMNTYFRDRNAVCDVLLTRENGSIGDDAGYASDTDAFNNAKSKNQLRIQQQQHRQSRVVPLPESRRVLLNVTFDCQELFEKSGLGTGNFMAGMYAIRLAAATIASTTNDDSTVRTDTDVRMWCPDADRRKHELILPWLTGFFPSPTSSSGELGGQLQLPDDDRVDDVCKTIDECPIGYMFPSIKYELRRMAVAMVGVPPREHSTFNNVREWVRREQHEQLKGQQRRKMQLEYDFSTAETARPLYPSTELDDAILHFRCGDLMNSNHPRFAFLKFEGFARHISTDARSIGIVTQPFDDGAQTRAWDSGAEKRSRCRIVVGAFVEYLEGRFPGANVRVYNSPTETIALTYARLVMANQTIAGISTFGVFPAIASFGTGYIRLPDDKSATNQWLTHPRLDTLVDDLVLMDEPNILMVRKVRSMWEEPDGEAKILEWFRDPSVIYE